MGLHKLTAGDGYTYLTRQVAVQDATEKGHRSLADYYAEHGESPGRWWGTGLTGLGLEAGSEVTETHMRNLFGAGRHPEAERLEAEARAAGRDAGTAARAGCLGRQFAVYAGAGHPLQAEVARRLVELNCRHGRPWNAPVSTDVRARIRTEVTDQMFRDEQGRPPLDDRERAGFLARASRQRTTAVAGYDLTFTPVKSVSVLWAVAPPPVAREVEAAHDAAVAATLEYLEREVLFTRRGRQGVQQVKTRGLVAAQFTHRDARSGDPNLHTHVAVSNKTSSLAGDWLAVDGRPLYKAAVTLSETYNTLLESELQRRLGVRFAARAAQNGKREIRELVGIDPALARRWSSRSSAIESRRRVLASDFQRRYGRPPTPVEAIALGQQATLETRQTKHAPRSEQEQRRAWRADAEEALGSPAAVDAMVERVIRNRVGARVSGRVSDVLSRPVRQPSVGGRVSRRWLDDTARQIVAVVSAERATWQIWHLRAEAQRQIRGADLVPDDLAGTVDRLVSAAISGHCVTIDDPDPLLSPGLTPAPLLRSDGESVYRQHAAQTYTSADVVRAEHRLLAAAHRTGARRANEGDVSAAITAATARGIPLDSAQRNLVRELLVSGRGLQLALAPAGAGKTTAMGVLADAWRRSGGQVLGLAPSAVAAQQLGEALADPAETLAKFAYSLRPGTSTPDWVEAIGASSLVVIDEAGMASTRELAAVVSYVERRGGSVRLVGDDRQLAAVAAGGVLRDLLHQVGAVTLTEVHRFRDNGEAAATLAIRSGDPTALAYYTHRGRVHTGDLTSAADQAFDAWVTDRDAGLETILLAPTRELVADLNIRARAHRLATAPQTTSEPERELVLPDGGRISRGDTVITRRNLRTIRLGPTDWVKNGDRWTVEQVHADGSARLRHHKLRRAIDLPSDYLAGGNLQLGYATTVHGAQGVTVDTAHTVLTGGEDRRLLYVALTRGRAANHIYVATAGTGEPHEVIRPESLRPPSTLDQLHEILARDGATDSATSTHRNREATPLLLHEAAARYHDALTTAAEHLLPPATADELDTLVAALAQAAGTDPTDAPAWPTLRAQLALQAHDGHDPLLLLHTAAAQAPLSDAHDVAAVLHSRVAQLAQGPKGPLPWLPGVPAAIASDREWGDYVTARAQRVDALVTDLESQAAGWSAADAPAWAHPLLGDEHTRLRAEVAVWRAVHDVPNDHPRVTGPRQVGAPGDHQSSLDRRIRAVIDAYPYRHRTWFTDLPDVVRDDPWSSVLGQRLASLERHGADLTALLDEAFTADRPLPDEQPAAAVWWRLVEHLGPAAVHQALLTSPLRPSWLDDLQQRLDEQLPGDRVDRWVTAPTWPALVAAVDNSRHRLGWTPAHSLAAALSHPLPGADEAEHCESLLLILARLVEAPPPPDDRSDELVPLEPVGPQPTLDPVPPDPAPAATFPRATRIVPSRREVAPDPATESRSRILQLNQLALAFYQDQYPRSWAPAYLAQRLQGPHLPAVSSGWSPLGVPEPAYAPPGPRSLIRHLTGQGVNFSDLVEAGLVRARERHGREEWVDHFRDRVVWPIRNGAGEVVGFIGRRNPTKEEYGGPKYLNTRTTTAFTKGDQLFGLHEAVPALRAGAHPVLVEGPLDALAVTLATDGQAVGVAPLGTALTPAQAEQLAWASVVSRRSLVVATDGDEAGRRAAEHDYWALTLADAQPDYLILPAGTDPAELAAADPRRLVQALDCAQPLGDVLIQRQLAMTVRSAGALTHEELAAFARLLSAQPVERWQPGAQRLGAALGMSATRLLTEVVHESVARDRARQNRTVGR